MMLTMHAVERNFFNWKIVIWKGQMEFAWGLRENTVDFRWAEVGMGQ